jgi:hypothetical protein
LGIGEDGRSGILVFPNPVRDNLKLVIPGNTVCNVELVRLDGVVVYNATVHGTEALIPMSAMGKGMYILKIARDAQVLVKKIIRD